MSGPDELDKLTEELHAAARNERPSEERKAAILEAVVGDDRGSGGSGSKKAFGVLLMAVLVGLFGWRLFGARADEVTPLPDPAPTRQVEPPPRVEAPPIEPPRPAPPPEVPPPTEPVAVEVPPAPSPEPVRQPSKPVDEVDLLAKEVQLLDSARAALPNEPRRALEVLEQHRREFPRGALIIDAELVRLEAYLRAGDRARATAVANKLIRSAPQSPVAARARRLLEEIP